VFGLRLVTPPESEPLTIAEAKHHLRIADGVNHDDHYVGSLIIAAREYVESYTNRQLLTATWDLTLDRFPHGVGPIYLPRAPLQSVVSVTYRDAAGVETVMEAANYEVNNAVEPGRIGLPWASGHWPIWSGSAASVVVVRFVAGYGSAGDVPKTLRQAMLLLVGHWFINREEVGRVGGRVELAAHALMNLNRMGDQFLNYG
jgi:uncharacterized phiE125 gp8 family phage protein